MSQSTPPSYLRAAEYIAIETAMMQSERGRGFLRDYLRRNRSAETETLLEAIAKLQRSLDDETGLRRLEDVRQDLTDVQRLIARTRREITAPESGLHCMAAEARQASGVIANAVAAISREIATLRERGAEKVLCADIERQADLIAGACVVIDLQRVRSEKLAAAFAQIEAEVMAILDLWDVDTRLPENFEKVPPKATLDTAMKNGLVEELTFAMLTDAQKAALFN